MPLLKKTFKTQVEKMQLALVMAKKLDCLLADIHENDVQDGRFIKSEVGRLLNTSMNIRDPTFSYRQPDNNTPNADALEFQRKLLGESSSGQLKDSPKGPPKKLQKVKDDGWKKKPIKKKNKQGISRSELRDFLDDLLDTEGVLVPDDAWKKVKAHYGKCASDKKEVTFEICKEIEGENVDSDDIASDNSVA